MARVRIGTRHKSGRGRDISCGSCGEMIEHGAQFKRWDFRYGGKHIRCMKPECAPRPGDLTQSKMGVVYNAQDDVDRAEDAEAVKEALEGLAETVRETAAEYEEAAEHFGGQGENQERYEALDGWADEIDTAVSDLEDAIEAAENAEEVEEEIDCDHCNGTGEVEDGKEDADGNDTMISCDVCGGTGKVENPDFEEDGDPNDALSEAVETAKGVAGECPV